MPEFPGNLNNVAVYLRKSRADIEAEARGEGETLSRHRVALFQLAEKHNYTITDTYEEIVSGERILDRPEMQRLLQRVRSGCYTAVMCMDLDRLGRGNMVDQGLIQETFKSSNTLIITPRKVYDLQDDLDEEWSEFEAFMARRELKIITRRLQRGRRQSASLGRSISKKPPYGYIRDESLRLHPDPKTAPVVQMIFSLAAEGCGMSKIAQRLTELGIETPSGRRGWDRSSIYAILKNPVYLGHIVWGRMKYQKSSRTGGRYDRIPQAKEDWIFTKNAHQPLVDVETYKAYMTQLERHPKVPLKRELANPLAGIVYCSRCGKSMRRQPTYHRPYHRLLCTTSGCQTKSARFELVEERIITVLTALLGTLKVEVDRPQNVTCSAALQVATQQMNELETSLTELVSQKSTLHELLERRIYDVDTYLERRRIVSEQIEEAERELHRLQAVIEELHIKAREANVSTSLVAGVMAAYGQTDSAALKNNLLKSVIERVAYTRQPGWTKPDQFTLDIYLRF